MAEYALLALGAAVAGFVQGVSGFAFSMVALAIWCWGVAPEVAVACGILGGLSGQVLATITVPRKANWPLLWPFLAGAALGVPLGVWAVPQLDAAAFRLMLGGLLLFACPAMLWAERWPTWQAPRALDALAGAIGGWMGAICGFVGVAPALWCTLRGMNKDSQRALIQNFNLAALGATAVAYLAAERWGWELAPRLAVVIPAMLVPAILGARLYKGLSPLAFRRVVLWVLTAAGALLVAAGWGLMPR